MNTAQLSRALLLLNDRAFPFATRHALNTAAFSAQKDYRGGMRKKLTLRNKFTVTSVRVDQARTLNVNRQESVVGSDAHYADDIESGSTRVSTGKEGRPIATGYSAGQRGQIPRTRLPRDANKFQSIVLRSRRRTGSRKLKNWIAVKQAATSGKKFIFMDLGRRKGIFKVTGGKRTPKVNMVYDMSHKTISTPATPLLEPAFQRAQPVLAKAYKKSLIFQLRRSGFNSR